MGPDVGLENIIILNYNKIIYLIVLGGGGTGIRTLGGLSPSSVFKTGAFDHSATPPTKSELCGFRDVIKTLNEKKRKEPYRNI